MADGHAVLVFRRVLPEVPDVAVPVLREPVERILHELTVLERLVPNLDASNAEDLPDGMCDEELVPRGNALLLAFVEEGRAGIEREVQVVYPSDVVGGVDRGGTGELLRAARRACEECDGDRDDGGYRLERFHVSSSQFESEPCGSPST